MKANLKIKDKARVKRKYLRIWFYVLVLGCPIGKTDRKIEKKAKVLFLSPVSNLSFILG